MELSSVVASLTNATLHCSCVRRYRYLVGNRVWKGKKVLCLKTVKSPTMQSYWHLGLCELNAILLKSSSQLNFFIHLKSRETEKGLPSIAVYLKCPWQSGLGQARAKSLEINPGFLCDSQGPDYTHHLRLPGCVGRKLQWEAELGLHLIGIWAS